MTKMYGNEELKLDADTRETIARAIHEDYRRARANKAPSQEPSRAVWDELLDHLKESNRQQADHILEKIHRIGHTVHKVNNRKATPITFTRDEVEIMAEMEHARWNSERLSNGWQWGEKRDAIEKTSPYLVPWSQLPDEIKEWDRHTVRNIPELLARVGLEIRRQRGNDESR
jgi:hypothetical protein